MESVSRDLLAHMHGRTKERVLSYYGSVPRSQLGPADVD